MITMLKVPTQEKLSEMLGMPIPNDWYEWTCLLYDYINDEYAANPEIPIEEHWHLTLARLKACRNRNAGD